MKTVYWMAMLAALVLLQPEARCRAEGVEEGVALAIIFDTSGSMKDRVPDAGGGRAPKYVIATRALARIADQIEAFRTHTTGTPRKIRPSSTCLAAPAAAKPSPSARSTPGR